MHVFRLPAKAHVRVTCHTCSGFGALRNSPRPQSDHKYALFQSSYCNVRESPLVEFKLYMGKKVHAFGFQDVSGVLPSGRISKAVSQLHRAGTFRLTLSAKDSPRSLGVTLQRKPCQFCAIVGDCQHGWYLQHTPNPLPPCSRAWHRDH